MSDVTMCDTQDSKESDLQSLEKRSEETFNNIRKARERLSDLLSRLRDVVASEKGCKEEVDSDCKGVIDSSPKNRLNQIEKTIGRIDHESYEFNTIILELESILK